MSGPDQTRTQEAVQLAVMAGLAAFTSLFGLWAIVSVAEAIGPSETRTGRVLQTSSFEWTSTSCDFSGSTAARIDGPCREFATPAGAVTGEFTDGDTWVVLDSEEGTSPSDVARRPGWEIAVTISRLTGRVTALDNGGTLDPRWSRIGSLGTVTVIVVGTLMTLTMAVLFRLRRRFGHSFGQLPRSVVIVAFALAVGIGAVGVWIGAVRSHHQYRVPSSADRYQGLIADPYAYTGTSDTAQERGRVVEVPRVNVVVRALEASEIVPEVRSAIEAEDRPIIALVTEPMWSGRGLSNLRVIVDDGDGGDIEAEACGGLEYPTSIGVDDRVLAGLFCLPIGYDSATVRIAATYTDPGIPIAAPVLE